VPFAFRTADNYPYGWQNNNAYSCAAFNTYNFVGWPNMMAVQNAVLSAASSNHLYVEEFDVKQELPTAYSTVVGRYMFDPTDTSGGPTGRDVLDDLRYYMGQHGSTSSWTQLAFSVSGFGNVDVAQYDCPSVYGDSARILPASELVAMIGGGAFGDPNVNYTNGLWCNGSLPPPYNKSITDGAQEPMSWSEPGILDIHTTMCLEGASGCESTQSTAATEATVTFSDIETFLNTFCPSGWRHNSTQLCGALFMLGETDVYQPQPNPYQSVNCVGSPVNVPAGNVQGFNASTLAGRTYNGSQPGVVFRPWTSPLWNALDSNSQVCFGFPQALQPTLVPTP
jgi:hypothetical protein